MVYVVRNLYAYRYKYEKIVAFSNENKYISCHGWVISYLNTIHYLKLFILRHKSTVQDAFFNLV